MATAVRGGKAAWELATASVDGCCSPLGEAEFIFHAASPAGASPFRAGACALRVTQVPRVGVMVEVVEPRKGQIWGLSLSH